MNKTAFFRIVIALLVTVVCPATAIAAVSDFDGNLVTSYLPVTNNRSFGDLNGMEGNAGLTFAAWVDFTANSSGGDDVFAKKFADTSNWTVRFVRYQKTLYLKIRTSNGNSPELVGGNVGGDRTHIAVTYNGSNMRLYVNGALSGSVSHTGTVANSYPDLVIGNNLAAFDNTRIYNRALTASEVLELYQYDGEEEEEEPIATSTPHTFQFSVLKNGAGAGTITATGISCGSDCSETVASGTTMTLSASPANGSTFGGWSGACSGTATTCNTTVIATTSATATFNLVPPPPPPIGTSTAVSWNAPLAVSGAPAVTTTITGDFNGDGITDIAAFEGGKHSNGQKLFAWFESPNFIKHDLNPLFVTNSFLGSAAAKDLDADGDLDIIFSMDNHGTPNGDVYWAQNPGNGSTGNWTINLVHHFADSTQHINDMVIEDMDNDGKADIIIRHLPTNEDKVRILFQNSLSSWTLTSINVKPREGLSIADLDADGRKDIILNGFWLASPTDPRAGTWQEFSIDSAFYTQSDTGLNNAAKTAAADLDNDGDFDVAIATAEGDTGKFAWYRNPGNPRTQNWETNVLEGSVTGMHQVEVGDIDRDGDMDLMSGLAFNQTGVFNYLFGSSTAAKNIVTTAQGIYFGKLADLDGDSDLDIVGPTSYVGQLYVYKNKLIEGVVPTSYTLTITKAGTGSGMVISSSPNLSCTGLMCSQTVAQGTTTLTAVPQIGSVFGGWTDGCSGTSTCIAHSSKTIGAVFTKAATSTSAWYVNPSATTSGDGRSWANAFNSISLIPWPLVSRNDVIYISNNNVVLNVTDLGI